MEGQKFLRRLESNRRRHSTPSVEMALPFIHVGIGRFFAECALRSSLTAEGLEGYTNRVTHE